MEDFLNKTPESQDLSTDVSSPLTDESVPKDVNPTITEPEPTNTVSKETLSAEPTAEGPVSEPTAQEPIVQEPIVQEPIVQEPQESAPNFTNQSNEPQPIYNHVNYSPVTPVSDYKPMNRGLKVFALVIAVVIVLTATGLGGYFMGKRSISYTNHKNTPSNVELAAKPKDTDEMTPAEVYQKLNESVVGITIYNTSGDGSQASGIVFSDDGYIVTNDHIYSEIPNAKFKIHTFDGKEYDAKYIAGDQISDLAVLKIENSKLKPAVFGNSDELYTGQNVVAVGRPNDATATTSITSGIVSALDRRVTTTSSYSSRLIQTDSPINPGSSGGALVNMYGQVVGVTSSKLASVEYEGVGYAIPTTIMKRIVDELIAEGKVVTRAKLGITYAAVNSVIAEINDIKHTGLLVDSVSEDSDLYNKIKKNDLITKINGTAITDDDIVLDIIENCRAGDKITVTVIDGEDSSVKTFEAELKANIGESSYTVSKSNEKDKDNSSDKDENGGVFDFPFGE